MTRMKALRDFTLPGTEQRISRGEVFDCKPVVAASLNYRRCAIFAAPSTPLTRKDKTAPKEKDKAKAPTKGKGSYRRSDLEAELGDYQRTDLEASTVSPVGTLPTETPATPEPPPPATSDDEKTE